MLRIEGLTAGYGEIEILHGISLEVNEGEIVALVGANGAGKTTTIRTISGLIQPTAGQISFLGQRIDRLPASKIVPIGVVQVPEGRKIFPSLSVLENLEVGSYHKGAKPYRAETLKRVFKLFPRLEERSTQAAGTLSGGEQQMLAIGRALMARPKLLMLDEPSLGLAPRIVLEIFDIIKTIKSEGLTVLLVEQNIQHSLRLADRGYVLENGNVVLTGTGAELLVNEHTKRAYLGM
ncbi:MAG: ABC transporter ATP-binding protein [Chloroflexi bacterium]|nr:ABC transporter ATP-binding protein [Chloroflexota bacterium]